MGRRATVTPAATMPLLFALVCLIAFGAAMLGVNRPEPAGAADVPGLGRFPGPTQAVAGATSAPAAASPAASAPPIAIDPAQLRALQQGARGTIRDLATAAQAGNLAAAQALLGDTAPDLRESGLRSASFTDVAAADIAVIRSGDEWIATAGLDRLVSRDGASWTFDYADRPLAVFAASAERDLYWLEPRRRDLYLRVASATVSRSGLSVRFRWRDPGADATYFDGASIAISSVTLGTRSMPLTTAPEAIIGATGRTATTHVPGTIDVPSTVLIRVAVSPGGSGTISTLFELETT
jgi:hypothetical protein